MQSKKSCFSKTIFMKNLTRFWPIWLGYLIISIMVLPMRILTSASNVSGFDTVKDATEYVTTTVNDIVSGAIAGPLLILVAGIVAVSLFYYLFNPKSANMIHALPVSREQLFNTNILSGLCMMWIPQLITFFVSLGASAICHFDGVSVLAKWLFLAVVYSFIFFAFAVLGVMLAGNALGALLFYGVFLFGVSGIKLICKMLVYGFVYGMGSNMTGISSFFSPGYYMCSKIGYLRVVVDQTTVYDMVGMNQLTKYFGIALIVMGFSLLAYKKRQLEVATELTAFSWMRPVFRWGVSFCASIAFTDLVITLFFWNVICNSFARTMLVVLISGIPCFFAAQMIAVKRFRIFTKKLLLECGIYSICMLGFLAFFELDLSGYEKYVPQASDVEQVESSFSANLTFDDESSIEAVIQLQQYAIDQKKTIEKELKYDSKNCSLYQINYKLKDGTSLSRSYYVPTSSADMNNDESLANKIGEFENDAKHILCGIFGKNYENAEVTIAQVGVVTLDDQIDGGYIYDQIGLSQEQTKVLYAAMLSDIKAGNMRQNCLGNEMEEWNKNTYYNEIYLSYTGGGDTSDNDTTGTRSAYVIFHSNSTNTIKALEKFGITKDQLVTTDVINELDEAFYESVNASEYE